MRAVLVFVVVFGGVLGAALILHPDSPLPDGWNPTEPLAIGDTVTPLTEWKLRQAVSDPALCQAILEDGAGLVAVTKVTSENPNCGVATAVKLSGVGQARVGVQTACETALRLAMWERHSLQPAARDILGRSVDAIRDQGSYNCRQMRTTRGGPARWSTHATAMAIDVRGLRLDDGTDIVLLRDWTGDADVGRFLRLIRDEACTWFGTVLGPDYNRLHADHFHLQSRGWGTCR